MGGHARHPACERARGLSAAAQAVVLGLGAASAGRLARALRRAPVRAAAEVLGPRWEGWRPNRVAVAASRRRMRRGTRLVQYASWLAYLVEKVPVQAVPLAIGPAKRRLRRLRRRVCSPSKAAVLEKLEERAGARALRRRLPRRRAGAVGAAGAAAHRPPPLRNEGGGAWSHLGLFFSEKRPPNCNSGERSCPPPAKFKAGFIAEYTEELRNRFEGRATAD